MRTIEQSSFLGVVEALYARMKGLSRTVRLTDHIRDDLGVDSLAAIELLAGLEEELDILLIDDPRLAAVSTIADLHELVCVARPSEVGRACA